MNTTARMRRLGATALAVGITGALLAGCASDSGTDGGGSGDAPRIGVSLNSLEYPFIVAMNDAMNAEAKESGVSLTTVDSRATVATELSQMENLITQRPDVIVMDAVDAESSQAAGKLVNQAGIPLVMVDNQFTEDSSIDVAAYVGTDLTETGRLEAEYLNKALPDGGDIIYIVGVYGAPWTEQRKAGFLEKVNSNFNIATEIEGKGSRADGKTVMEDLLRKYAPGQIQAVVAQNDEMAIGAISAIKEAGRMDDFKVIIAVDGSAAGIKAVADGDLTATVRQDPEGVGNTAIQVAAKVARGESVDAVNLVPLTVVDANNVKEFE